MRRIRTALLRGTYTDDGHERGTVKNQTSSLAGRGALPPQAVWRLAPYRHEPGEDEKQILSPARHVVRTVNFIPYLLRVRRG